MGEQNEIPDTTNWKTADEHDPNYIFAQHVADNVSVINRIGEQGKGVGGRLYSADIVSYGAVVSWVLL